MLSLLRSRLILSAASVLLLASVAHAQGTAPRRVAVVRVDFEGVPEVGKVFLSQRLMEALASAEFQPFAGPVVDNLLRQGGGLENCREESCYRQIAERLGVQYLVTGRVQVDKKNYEVVLRLLGGREGKELGQSRERCDLCGIREVGKQMDGQIVALRELADAAAATAPARYAIRSRPEGAAVTVDGKSAGVTPLTVDLPAGSHRVSVAADGFRPTEQRLDVETGTNGLVSIDLTPEGADDVTSPLSGGGGRGRPPWRLVGWASLLVGALVAAGGGVALSFNGDVLSCVAMEGGVCTTERVRDTKLIGGILIGAGGALMIGGGTMLYLGWSDGRSQAPGSSAFVGVRGRF